MLVRGTVCTIEEDKMTLTELKLHVDRAHASAIRMHQNPDNITACIKVFNPHHVGGSAVVGVQSVAHGFDWDQNKCIIRPDMDVVGMRHGTELR